jgi:hypothetical protein
VDELLQLDIGLGEIACCQQPIDDEHGGLLIANREDVLRLDLESGDLWKFWRRAPARMS